MAKDGGEKGSESGPIGNPDPNKRGRGGEPPKTDKNTPPDKGKDK
jgi:hypothetical protein